MPRLRFALALVLASTFPASASITGTVMTRDGQPVAGARVATYARETTVARRARLISEKPEQPSLATATTVKSGAFTLESPKDPVVVLRVNATGFAPSSVTIERDEENAVIVLVPAAMKQGKITAAGKGVANARVIWSGASSEVIATTAADGSYSVPDVTRWAGRVTVYHPDYAIADEPLGPRGQAELNRILDGGTAVSGRAVLAAGKSPAAKAAISVDGWPRTLSADDGTFTVAHAPKNWEAIEASSGDLVARHARAGKSAMVLALAPGAVVAGTLSDTHRQPIAGAMIELAQRTPGMPGRGGFRAAAADTVTDAKGNFSLRGVAPGAYQIISNHPAYAVAPTTVTLLDGQHLQRALAATARARITGSVVDEQRHPVAAASVSADAVSRERGAFARVMRMAAGGGMPQTAFSGPDGRFSVRTEAHGDVEIEAARKGLPGGRSTAIHVDAGDRKSGVIVTIPRGLALTGRVTDAAGNPLSDVAVIPSEAETGPMPGNIRRAIAIGIRNEQEDEVTTAADGTFTTRLKEGTYDLIFRRSGFSTKSVRGIAVNASTAPVSVTLSPGAEITGHVIRSGAGVPGVNIAIAAMENPTTTVSGPDGSFTIGDLTPGSYMAILSKPDEFVQQMRNVTAPASDLTIELPAGGRVTGRVIDKSSRQPVASFQAGVSLSRAGGAMQVQMPAMMKSFTSDDGSFTLDNVPAGTTTVVASAPGFVTARASNVNVEEGKTTEGVELALDSGVRLTGRVTGPSGGPLAGVAVRPDSGGGGMIRMVMNVGGEGLVTTDANGEYSLDQLEPGEKSFEFSLDGYLPATKSVQLTGREAHLDVQLAAGMRVTGSVVTEAGAPVADADIRSMSAVAGGGMRTTKTDAAGGFAFDGMAPGHYTFTASKSGFADGTVRDFDVSAGAPVRIALRTGGSIYGHVTGIAPQDLGSVTVNARSGAGSAEAPVDSSGSYRIDGAPTGSVRVSAEMMRSFSDARESEVKTVEVTSGSAVQVDLEFGSANTLRGRVTRNGVAMAGASVAFMPTGGGGSRIQVATDDSGNYSASGLTNGQYTVLVIDTQRLNPYTTNYTVNGSSTFDIDIRSAQVRGRVTDSGSGDPVANARVQVRGTSSDAPMSVRGALTDESGAFTVDSVAPGQYTVSAEKEGYGNDVRDIAVTESGATPVELRIAKNDGVVLKVVDARDGQPLSPNVVVYDASGRVVFESLFRTGEKLTLAPGQYRATVGAMNYAPRTVSFTSPSTQTVGLTPGGTISIRFKEADPSRRARLIDAGGQVYARPMSPDGSYPAAGATATIANVAPGNYTIEITLGGAVVARPNVAVVEGQVATVTP